MQQQTAVELQFDVTRTDLETAFNFNVTPVFRRRHSPHVVPVYMARQIPVDVHSSVPLPWRMHAKQKKGETKQKKVNTKPKFEASHITAKHPYPHKVCTYRFLDQGRTSCAKPNILATLRNLLPKPAMGMITMCIGGRLSVASRVKRNTKRTASTITIVQQQQVFRELRRSAEGTVLSFSKESDWSLALSSSLMNGASSRIVAIDLPLDVLGVL